MMEQNAFHRVKSGINKGITAVSLKTNSSLEKAKINTHMESLKAEIERLEQDIGHKAYILWEAGNFECSKIEEELLIIKKKQEKIDELNVKMEDIEKYEKEILGQLENTNHAHRPENFFCPQCGYGYGKKVNFCIKCGCKLN
ncbi:MAG: hypothetical protein PUC12_02635 [Clostridiales bacterium]|nr:hypothetical protein [Clostridiales bacterium]